MRLSIPVLISLALCLAACGKSPENPTPAVSTTPAAASAMTPAPSASTAATPGTAAAATAGTAPVAVTSSAVASATTVAPGEATTTGPEVAGQVALAQGSVTDTAKDGSSRVLKDGDSVYPGDSFVLGQDSYLDLDLEDTGRILLRPNTTFQIASYHYEADAHDPNGATDANGQPLIKPQQPENAFFKLVKGGLRAIDGVIGHTTPQNYGVETPVATIGVRGTAFDVRYCGDDCADETDTSGKPDNGLYTSVSDGTVAVKNDDGEVLTPAGHSGFVKSRKQRMQALASPPKALRHMDLPEKLKPRANQNRSNLRVKRQKRRQLIQQRRRAAVAAKAKAGPQDKSGSAKPKPAGPKPGAKDQKPETPAQRRQERKEERKQQHGAKTAAPAAVSQGKAERLQKRGEKLRQQEGGQGRAAPAKGTLKPGTQGGEGGATPREQLREKRQERHQQKQQQADKPAQAAAPADVKKGRADKPAKTDDCKDKKKRKKAGKDKDKDKCGGD